MSIYREYARVYDGSGQLGFSLKLIPYLNNILERHPVGGRTMLELACGTGTVALAFAEAGWRVYAIDGSAEMLKEARAKAEKGEASERRAEKTRAGGKKKPRKTAKKKAAAGKRRSSSKSKAPKA